MSGEGARFQSATGQSIDDNCSLLFASSSPLFYTVNPRSGISLRQQEQLGAPSILKSFRDLPGCTRLSSSLSNLDGKRTQFPLLPDIHQRDTMGRSLPGHQSTKRFVRERYNPPFKVNAKIRHVYTQEVTTIEGQGQNHHNHHSHHPHAHHLVHATCHSQTQTEPDWFPESVNSKPEVEPEEGELSKEKVFENEKQPLLECDTTEKVDASTSPIPPESLQFPDRSSESGYPFSGCSQMTVCPPLNYVKKLEDLEKITGHIVIQRFFTRTDDAFGSWLEKQLGMTSKSVSVDTSEFENAKTAECKDEVENEEAEDTDDAIVIEGGIEEGIEDGQTEMPGSKLTTDANHECAFADTIKCECFLEEIERAYEFDRLKELEDQIIPLELADNASQRVAADEGSPSREEEIETLLSAVDNEIIPMKKRSQDVDIDEVVRCTLEAYLLAPGMYDGEVEDDHGISGASPAKSEIDSGRADSIQSQDNKSGFMEGSDEVEGNTSHDSVETVYEIPIAPENKRDLEGGRGEDGDMENDETASRLLQRSLSADSCIGTESSGDTNKNQTNESQSSNDLEALGMDNSPSSASRQELKELVEMNLGSTATTVVSLLKKSASATATLAKRKESAKSQRSITFEEQGRAASTTSSRSHSGEGVPDVNKTDGEDADASASESEISQNGGHEHTRFLMKSKNAIAITNFLKQGHDGDEEGDEGKLIETGTDLELEEVEEYEGEEEDDDAERDAFDAMVANHLKYSRGMSTGGAPRRSRLNRGTQTTKSIEPSTSGSLSPCSSSNSSFDVEIISKSKRITTASSAGGDASHLGKHDMTTPSNMSMAWHEGGRRRSYLPNSSSSLNLLNMKFSLGKDFESEVSIRVPAKSSNMQSSSSLVLPPGSGTGGKTLMSGSSRHHHHSYFQHQQSRGQLSSSGSHGQAQQNPYPQQQAAPSTLQSMSISEPTELQSLWKDVRTRLDVQVDEMAATVPEERDVTGVNKDLHVRGSGILPVDPIAGTPHSNSGGGEVKSRRNEERIKRSLQRLKKILED